MWQKNFSLKKKILIFFKVHYINPKGVSDIQKVSVTDCPLPECSYNLGAKARRQDHLLTQEGGQCLERITVHPITPQTRTLDPTRQKLAQDPMEAKALKNYLFTLLQRQLIFRPVLGNLVGLKDNGASEGKVTKMQTLATYDWERPARSPREVTKSLTGTIGTCLSTELQKGMFIICRNSLCYYMTHSCMPGMLSSGNKQRLPNYKVCNNYHCLIHDRQQVSWWSNCYCASRYYQLFLLCLKALRTLSFKLINLQPPNCLEMLTESASSQGESTTGVWVD